MELGSELWTLAADERRTDMMSSLWLQVGPSYGFSRAVEDRWLRDFEESLAMGDDFAAEGMAEVPAQRQSVFESLAARVSSLAHAITVLEVRRRHA